LRPGWERRWKVLGYGNDLLMIPCMSGVFLAFGVEIWILVFGEEIPI